MKVLTSTLKIENSKYFISENKIMNTTYKSRLYEIAFSLRQMSISNKYK